MPRLKTCVIRAEGHYWPTSRQFKLRSCRKPWFSTDERAEAAKQADIINILLPDEVQGDVYRTDIKPNLVEGNVLMCSHGFNFHFGQIEPPKGVDVLLVARRGLAIWCVANSKKVAAFHV